MLIEFEVGNFLSFRDPMRLSMLAANSFKEYLDENTVQKGQYRLLKSVVIYGANASGKSNLLASMAFMREFVLNSSKETQVDDPIPVRPFKLDTTTEKAPSHFEICFIQNEIRYRYGFEADTKSVRKEWLFQTKKAKEVALFLREDDAIDVGAAFSEGKGLEDKTRDNALFLSVVAQFNGKISGNIIKWFIGFRALHGLLDEKYERFTASLLREKTVRPLLIELVRRADVGIEDLIVNDEQDHDDSLAEEKGIPKRTLPHLRIATVHNKFSNGLKTGSTNLDFSTEESEGTKKFFRIAGPLLDSLMRGYIVCIDELDAKLHPLLSKSIVSLFNSLEANPTSAQLIFATHDTNLLQYGKLRRDQIWFTEKTQKAATDLYSLAEIKLPRGTKVRNDEALEKNYIQGRYGAIPFLGGMIELFKERVDGASSQNDRQK